MPVFTVNYDSILTLVSSVRPSIAAARFSPCASPAGARRSFSSHVLSSLFSTSCEQVRCPRCTYATGMTLAWDFSRGWGGGRPSQRGRPACERFHTLHGLPLRGGGLSAPGPGGRRGGLRWEERGHGEGCCAVGTPACPRPAPRTQSPAGVSPGVCFERFPFLSLRHHVLVLCLHECVNHCHGGRILYLCSCTILFYFFSARKSVMYEINQSHLFEK